METSFNKSADSQHKITLQSSLVYAVWLSGTAQPGREVYLAIDVASSHFYHDGRYHLDGDVLDSPGMIRRIQQFTTQSIPVATIVGLEPKKTAPRTTGSAGFRSEGGFGGGARPFDRKPRFGAPSGARKPGGAFKPKRPSAFFRFRVK